MEERGRGGGGGGLEKVGMSSTNEILMCIERR